MDITFLGESPILILAAIVAVASIFLGIMIRKKKPTSAKY